MLVPALGFILSTTFFGVVGAVALRRGGVRPLRPAVLAAFVVAAQAAVLAFGAVYAALVANGDDHLTSAGAVVGLLFGMPVAGTLCGWYAARWVAARQRGAQA